MTEQKEQHPGPSTILETLETLTKQLSLDPSIQVARALVGTQSDIGQVKSSLEEITTSISKLSTRTEQLITQSGPLTTLPEATKKLTQDYPISWGSVDIMTEDILTFFLALLEEPTEGAKKRKRNRLRRALGLTEPVQSEAAQDVPEPEAEDKPVDQLDEYPE